MLTSDFDFELPAERIALKPVQPRDAARMLVVRPQGAPRFENAGVLDLARFLEPGDALVVNDTRVIPAALRGVRRRAQSEAQIHLNLVRQVSASNWLAFAKPGRRLAVGDRVQISCDSGYANVAEFVATVARRDEDGLIELTFNCEGDRLATAIAAHGEMPLPPYIASRRPANAADRSDYQTLFARRDGSVASPTAALHFTPRLLALLEERDVTMITLTLHVGAGTFLPVKSEETSNHRMHAEWGEISGRAANKLNETHAKGGRLVAVGTTALRLLETAADAHGHIRPFVGETDLFITPGYGFRAVDVLMTNFHLPRSTLFMLVSAFSGLDTVRAAYAHAIATGYRFYSYGDSTLLYPQAAARGRSSSETGSP